MQRAPASWWHIIGLLTAVALLTIVLHWACGGAVVPVAFLGVTPNLVDSGFVTSVSIHPRTLCRHSRSGYVEYGHDRTETTTLEGFPEGARSDVRGGSRCDVRHGTDGRRSGTFGDALPDSGPLPGLRMADRRTRGHRPHRSRTARGPTTGSQAKAPPLPETDSPKNPSPAASHGLVVNDEIPRPKGPRDWARGGGNLLGHQSARSHVRSCGTGPGSKGCNASNPDAPQNGTGQRVLQLRSRRP